MMLRYTTDISDICEKIKLNGYISIDDMVVEEDTDYSVKTKYKIWVRENRKYADKAFETRRKRLHPYTFEEDKQYFWAIIDELSRQNQRYYLFHGDVVAKAINSIRSYIPNNRPISKSLVIATLRNLGVISI